MNLNQAGPNRTKQHQANSEQGAGVKALALQKKPTIRDIAAMVGLSHTTVSRVLNGEANVRQETRDKVMSAVNSVGFTPNPMAQALSRSRSNLIGLMLSDISNPFYNEIIRGVEDEATRRGFRIMLHSTAAILNEQEDSLGYLLGSGVDGFIVLSARMNDTLVEALVRSEIPTVLVHRGMANSVCSSVTCNQGRLTELVLRHLHGLGRRRIALVNASRHNIIATERLRVYQQLLKEFDLPYREEYVYFGRCFQRNGVEAAEQFFALPEPPDAIFASNDAVALGVMDVVFRAGLEVPKDVSIVGSDNAEFSSNPLLALTTVETRKYEMGTMGAQIFIDALERKRQGYLHKVELEPALIVRRSCGAELFAKQSSH